MEQTSLLDQLSDEQKKRLEDLKCEPTDLEECLSDADPEEFDDGQIPRDEAFQSTIIITNLPKVEERKLDKLKHVLAKTIRKVDGCGEEEPDIYMPINEEEGHTDGVAVVTFAKASHAAEALKVLDHYHFGKANVLRTFAIDHRDEVLACNDDGTMPEEDEGEESADHFQHGRLMAGYTLKDTRDWMLDKEWREMLAIRYEKQTEVSWYTHLDKRGPVIQYDGARERAQRKVWTDSNVAWSPRGTFLVTFHAPGVNLWGGENFEKKIQCEHARVRRVIFTNNERYLMTWNGTNPSHADLAAVRIFDLFTGECKRTMPLPELAAVADPIVPAEPAVSGPGAPVAASRGRRTIPMYMWSHSGDYFAKRLDNGVMIYETPSMEMKEVLKYPGITAISWCPAKRDILAVWVPESANSPARFALLESKKKSPFKEIVAKNAFQIDNSRPADIYWHPQGDYVATNVLRVSKSGKTGNPLLEIFRLNEKGCPAEKIELKNRAVKAVHWEPHGNRLAVVNTSTEGRDPKIWFYEVKTTSTIVGAPATVEKVAEYSMTNYMHLFKWNTFGKYWVMWSESSGEIVFGCLTPENKVDIHNTDEHFMLNHVAWDPSGRYLLTAVTQNIFESAAGRGYRNAQESGFCIWSFQGRLMYKCPKESLWFADWRPHPKQLLSEKEVEAIRKDYKQYIAQYEAGDRDFASQQRAAAVADRKAIQNDFRSMLKDLKEYRAELCKSQGCEDWEQGFKRLAASRETVTFTETREIDQGKPEGDQGLPVVESNSLEKDSVEADKQMDVSREPLSGYEDLVTEEDLYALERSRRGPRRPSWKLLNPPRKKTIDEANPVGQRRASPSKRRSSPDYADLLPSGDEESDDEGHQRRRGRSRELTTADIGKKSADKAESTESRRGSTAAKYKRKQFYRHSDNDSHRRFFDRNRHTGSRFEDHYKKYTTVEDQKRVQSNRVAGISDFLAWAKDAKGVGDGGTHGESLPSPAAAKEVIEIDIFISEEEDQSTEISESISQLR
ncbi:Translation initiation factor 3 subunit b [Perkinsus olseni]|uniref:Translation initiation factor 3 subunit b n=1 Tax=Perkinsus olseni TaxID=32597 RepID=A0A7J6MR56_PEROL|nr:Translation initiation factor 3 subunit b [Perkinsus olseni]